jgi:hypothetical protein
MRHLAWIFLGVVTLAGSASALKYEVGGCKTGSGYLNFTTISAAVVSVPAGSTVLVCPGVYHEQVTIKQPLTLKGIPSGNNNRAVITANPDGNFAPNVASVNGSQVYAQVLVENVVPVGAVDLVGITVDGSGINFDCPSTSLEYLAGIFYASGTSGAVSNVTTRNQLNISSSGSCGFGIWAENGGGASQTINITSSSVHHIGSAGLVALTNSSTLTADISKNFVTDTGIGFSQGGIEHLAAGTLAGNVVTLDINTPAITLAGPVNAQGNIIADGDWAFDIAAPGTTLLSNYVSNVQVGIAIEGVPATLKSNNIAHTSGCAFSFTHNPNSAILRGNHINDSPFAFANLLGPSIGGNVLFNIDNILGTTSFCP